MSWRPEPQGCELGLQQGGAALLYLLMLGWISAQHPSTLGRALLCLGLCVQMLLFSRNILTAT